MKFCKYHGLGNDYIVLDSDEAGQRLSPEQIRLICDRHFGLGGDGILLGSCSQENGGFAVQIFNPDGQEAEKSGNGLRIFSRYLWDRGKVTDKPFDILTKGGRVRSQVHNNGKSVTVEMGCVSFDSQKIPVAGELREVLNEEIEILDRTFTYCAATIGNPHCVIRSEEISKAQALRYGPAIEKDARFPNRTNVQFMKILDRHTIHIEIWERGAGYTLASGSSSCASAAVARRMGWCEDEIEVRVAGGSMNIDVGKDYAITMSGPVEKICEGTISEDMFS